MGQPTPYVDDDLSHLLCGDFLGTLVVCIIDLTYLALATYVGT